MPTRFERLAGTVVCSLGHDTDVELLQLVVQRNVDDERRGLHTEQVSNCGDDEQYAIDPGQRPDRSDRRDDHRENRPDPHQHEQRLIVLNHAIDGLKRPDERAVVKPPDARHHHYRKGEQKSGDQ